MPAVVKLWQVVANCAVPEALHIATVKSLQLAADELEPLAVAMAVQHAGSLEQALQSAAAPPAPPVALLAPPVPVEPPEPVEPPLPLVPAPPLVPPLPPEPVVLWQAGIFWRHVSNPVQAVILRQACTALRIAAEFLQLVVVPMVVPLVQLAMQVDASAEASKHAASLAQTELQVWV